MKLINIFAIFLFGAGIPAAELSSPNILIITVDNLGYGDLRCYHSGSSISTPNLDRLAREGARLTEFYTASPTCTVSRACLLTGRVPGRHGLEHQLPGVEGNYGVGLNQKEILIPQLLKTAPTPYVAGCFGKWNIGFAPGSRPTERGFDEFIGNASGNMDYYRHNYNERHDLYQGIEELHREGEYATDLLAESAAEFIERRSKDENPWFCYLPFNAPHFPSPGNRRNGEPNTWQAPDWAFQELGMSPGEMDPEKRYGAVVYALDKRIGDVLDALERTGKSENTFVFFMSDNGAFRLDREGLDVGSNNPLRNGGVTCWEGGIRVAAMTRWPGKIKAGSIIDEPFWSPDLMAACVELAGVTLPGELVLDGKNPLPLLTKGEKSPHKSFYFEYQKQVALRQGDWKIIRENPNQPWLLFNLKSDRSETQDLAEKNPEKVSELKESIAAWKKSFPISDSGNSLRDRK